jgi:hypothetical protein
VDIKRETLEINGYSGLSVRNSFLRQIDSSQKLTIIFPGLHYSCDKPLLYYAALAALQAGMDVLQVKTDYTTGEFQLAAREQRAAWILTDAHAALQGGLQQGHYTTLLLIGKSIGTLAMAGLLKIETNSQLAAIWLTPLLNQPLLVDAALSFTGRSLYVGGTADDTFIPEVLSSIEQSTNSSVYKAPGANHSLEIPGDINQSLVILAEVVKALEGFINKVVNPGD